MASNKLESDEDDELTLQIDYQAENYTTEELVTENNMLKKSIEQKRQQLKDKHKRINERLKKEEEELDNQLRIADATNVYLSESLSSQTKEKRIYFEQDQEENPGLPFATLPWKLAEETKSHSENSDFYIEVNSCSNRSPQPSLISNIYASVGSASYASVQPGKLIRNGSKKSCKSVRRVKFTLLTTACLVSTTFTALILLHWRLSGSDYGDTTPITSQRSVCNRSDASDISANNSCIDTNANETSMQSKEEMIRSHFISYVDEAFIHEQFEAGYNTSAITIVGKELREWQGVLFRNRTFLTKAGPLRLKFFKEKFDDKADGRLFDFDEITGVFHVRYHGVFSVYANISSINVGRHSGKPMFAVLHKRKTERRAGYYKMYNIFSKNSVHDNKIKNYMKETIYLNVGDTVELQSMYKHTLIYLDYGEAYFGGSFVVEKDVE